jgi:hypothetical protein
MPVRKAAPSGSNRCQRRNAASCSSGFQETSTIPATTRIVPKTIKREGFSPRIATAMAALTRGLID